MLRKIVFFIVFFPLLIVPLFCSCVPNVEAATVGVEHHDDADNTSSNTKADHHDQGCNCGHASSAILEYVIPSQVSFSFNHIYFSPQITSIEPKSALKTSIHFAYLGPPVGISEVPLYIQQHSLRI